MKDLEEFEGELFRNIEMEQREASIREKKKNLDFEN